jgi:3-hydroxyisobutyrate dehydrogenase-like beta-hydroxyacid dehydrogenase
VSPDPTPAPEAAPGTGERGSADTGLDVHALRVALIGYGEVGGIFARALRDRGVAALTTYDRLFDDPARRDAALAGARADGVVAAPDSIAAVRDADLVLCAVTADQTHAAAAATAPGLRAGTPYVDFNSASPRTKVGCAAIVDAAGGRYVEAAVMTSVPPHGIGVPMLWGGPHATGAARELAALGFRGAVAADTLGTASAIKMCRSVIVKGLEGIVIESFATARRYGVEREVLASLAETFPGLDWERSGSYFFQRVARHGRRRAEEMREAAATVREAGLEPVMAAAIAERHAFVAHLAECGAFAALDPDATGWRELADAIERATAATGAPDTPAAGPRPRC